MKKKPTAGKTSIAQKRNERVIAIEQAWHNLRFNKRLVIGKLLSGEQVRVFLMPREALMLETSVIPNAAIVRFQAFEIFDQSTNATVHVVQCEGEIMEVIFPGDFDRKPEFPRKGTTNP